MEGDSKVLNEKIDQREQEIAELKLLLTSKDMELQQKVNDDLTGYGDELEDLDSQDKVVEEGEDSRYDLSSKFDRTQNQSQILIDENGVPLVESELSQLTDTNASEMMHSSP